MAGKSSKKFDLGELSRALSGAVPDSGTTREQIEYIDVDLLDSDPGNFYALRDLDDLAANIATIGLQQPIRVRDGEGGHVVIVSGHRRVAAIRKLVAEGRAGLREVPCIRESDDASPALRELRLIYANSSTRDLVPAELAQQAEKVRELLYQLQEEGFEFPGRMRDHVAEACRISRSKLARLEKIQTRLAPCYRSLWASGQLPEDTADALAGLPQAVQERIKRVCPKKTPTASNIREIGAKMKTGFCYDVIGLKCPDGGVCTQRDKFLKHNLTCYGWERCSGGKCCVECSAGGAHRVDGSACGAACAEMCAKARAIYEKAKAKQKDSEEREAAKARSKAVQKAMADAARIVRAAEAAGLSDKGSIPNGCSGSIRVGTLRSVMLGEIPEGMSDYQLGEFIPYRTETLRKMAEMLHCSTDYLLGLTDELNAGGAEPGQMALAAWMPGGTTPAEPCDVVAEFDLSGDGKVVARTLCRWDGEAFRFGKGKDKIEVRVVRWLALPDVEKEDGNDD